MIRLIRFTDFAVELSVLTAAVFFIVQNFKERVSKDYLHMYLLYIRTHGIARQSLRRY